MSFRNNIVSLIVLLSTVSLAQNPEKYFSLVSLSDSYKLNQLEKLELPVYHYYNESLFTVLTSSEIPVLDNLNIEYRLLDKKVGNDKYFIITSENKTNINIDGDQIIYTDRKAAIAKNIQSNNSLLRLKNLKAVELKPAKLFKNQKYVINKYQALSADSLISQVVSEVSSDSVRYFIQSLQNFQTRYLYSPTKDSVANWIKTQFISWGYTDVALDSFEYNGTWQTNVVATLQGTEQPDVINVFGGHHDSYSRVDPMVFAPGADDNASGTAAVLETARILKEKNYQPESTIKFVTFAAEELGLHGSAHFAQTAFNSSINIKTMINHDMISHTLSSVENSSIDINYYSGSEYLRELAIYCTGTYSNISAQFGQQNSGGSDSYSFWQLGFPSVYFEESDFSPYWHQPGDTIGNYNMVFCAEVIKSSCATLLMNIVIPSMVQNYRVYDVGNGSSLKLFWSPNAESDLAGYKIYVGTSSGIYDTTYITTDTLYTLNNLNTNTEYFIGVSVYDNSGYESTLVERVAVPKLFPLPPSDFVATPQWLEVQLEWNKNSEYDLLGYNLYRSNTEGELGDKLNSQVITDTTYTDITASNGIYYYYTVKAVDSLLNESLYNATVKSRVVSLDQGILVVDETKDGDGSLMNPSDEQVDAFFNQLLDQYNHYDFDVNEEGSISITDLGAYSTVIWHGNDFKDVSAPNDYKDEIKKYLSFGGSFLYSGYLPGKAFEQATGNPFTFESGDFIYDYLKIHQSAYRITALFIGANSIESGYADIFIDSSKTNQSEDYHLRHIESINSSPEGTNIYTFETHYDSTSPQGIFKGKPVGVEYIGVDYKTVTLSFPLYYMNHTKAQELIDYILVSKFNEIVSVENDKENVPQEFYLSQNYPNPFNPNTSIEFSLPVNSDVTLTIYNLLGQTVTTLVNEEISAGNYNVVWNGEDRNGFKVSSGIYLYKMQANGTNGKEFQQIRKMVLLK